MSKLQTITTFMGTEFDQGRLNYYEHYATQYYNGSFRSDQGTEVILNTLRKNGPPGKWLDLGAGPATFFWSLVLKGITELHCSEIYAEGLKVLDDVNSLSSVPKCYQDVMEMFELDSKHLEDMQALPRKYLLFDALQAWPNELAEEQYDLITAFGVFGLTTSPEDYERCFAYMKPFLKPGAIAIGANWIRSQEFIDRGNSDNRFLHPQLVRRAAENNGYRVAHLSVEPIIGDPNYTSVIIWALTA